MYGLMENITSARCHYPWARAGDKRRENWYFLFTPVLFFIGAGAWLQVSVTLATLGIPDTVSNDALGYELSDDALQFLRTVKPRKGKRCLCTK